MSFHFVSKWENRVSLTFPANILRIFYTEYEMSCTSSFSWRRTKQDVGAAGCSGETVEQVPGRMIAPLLLYLSLITEHQNLLRGDIQAKLNNLNSSDENRTTTISENSTEVTVTSTGKYEEIFRNTSNSHQELFKLNSTSEENPHSDETGFLKTTNLIPSSMIGYYQTNFSRSTEVKGKIRKVFLR